jgi:hypothetical protein
VKKASILFLFLFLNFLSAPTVIKLIEKHSDVSQFFNFSEEEDDGIGYNAFPFEEKPIVISIFQFSIYKPFLGIPKAFQLRHDKVAEEIFIPPPENS